MGRKERGELKLERGTQGMVVLEVKREGVCDKIVSTRFYNGLELIV